MGNTVHHQLIKDKGFTLEFIATKLRMTRRTLHSRLNNTDDFTIGEYRKLCEILNIKPEIK